MKLLGPSKKCGKCKQYKLRKYFSKDHGRGHSRLDGLQRWCKDCARERTEISNKEGKAWRKQEVKRAKERAERRAERGLPPIVSKYREYTQPTKWSV